MIVFPALLILTFNTSACFYFFAYITFMFVSLFLYVLDAFDIYSSIFLLKVTFRNPNGTNIMYPNIMTNRLIVEIGCLVKVIIIQLLLLLFAFITNFIAHFIVLKLGKMGVLFLLFVVRTFF